MTWNFDIDAAPRGKWIARKNAKGIEAQVYQHDRVIVACRDGVTVTASRCRGLHTPALAAEAGREFDRRTK